MIDIPKLQAAILRGEKCAPPAKRLKFGRARRQPFLPWNELDIASPAHCPQLPRKLTEVNITPREFDVLQLLGAGKRNQEIAECLGIGQRTVKAHLHSLFLRTGLTGGHKRGLLASAFVEQNAAMPILQL